MNTSACMQHNSLTNKHYPNENISLLPSPFKWCCVPLNYIKMFYYITSYYPLCISHKAKILGTPYNITQFSNITTVMPPHIMYAVQLANCSLMADYVKVDFVRKL